MSSGRERRVALTSPFESIGRRRWTFPPRTNLGRAAALAPGRPALTTKLSFPAQKIRCQVLNFATRVNASSMSEDNLKIYILGAGCSRDCGYPLAVDMIQHLREFADSLDASRASRLLHSVRSTLELMERKDHGKIVDTIDTLVAKINDGQFDESNAIMGEEMQKRHSLRHERIQAAKLAVSTMFHFKESAAIGTGLNSYRDFLYDLFPGASSRWWDNIGETNYRVLSFNYDRMFEIAFHDRFNIDLEQWGFYGGKVLNSGLDVVYNKRIEFERNRFSFLKLHGSIEMWVGDDYGETSHGYRFPKQVNNFEPTDDLYFAEPVDGPHPLRLKATPIMVFPHERQFIRGNKSGYPFHRYIEKVWEYAEELVGHATEVVIIGYRFAGIDRQPFLDLLSRAKACKKIIVHNPEAKHICDRLFRSHPEWRGIITDEESGF